uniref:Uncharacterized protein n=1 Tax=Thermocrispum agreste TaxID=37925 RepID=A0A2W4IRM9_9PSEU|nr:MAG: hypothetical protein DIU77_19415 [Thermocrispum agreste]
MCMSNVRRMVGTLLAAVVAAVVFWASGQTEEQGPVSAPGEVAVSEQSADVAALLDEIPTRPETGHRTYDREEWRHWITVTGDPRWGGWGGGLSLIKNLPRRPKKRERTSGAAAH